MCRVWQYGLSSFQAGGTKLENIFFLKINSPKGNYWIFEIGVFNGEVSKNDKIWLSTLDHLSIYSVLVKLLVLYSIVLFWRYCVLKQNNWELTLLVLNNCLNAHGLRLLRKIRLWDWGQKWHCRNFQNCTKDRFT